MIKILRVSTPVFLVIVCLLCACNRQTANSSSPGALVIFPPPPDTTRIQFLTHFSSSGDLVKGTGGIQKISSRGGGNPGHHQTLRRDCAQGEGIYL